MKRTVTLAITLTGVITALGLLGLETVARLYEPVWSGSPERLTALGQAWLEEHGAAPLPRHASTRKLLLWAPAAVDADGSLARQLERRLNRGRGHVVETVVLPGADPSPMLLEVTLPAAASYFHPEAIVILLRDDLVVGPLASGNPRLRAGWRQVPWGVLDRDVAASLCSAGPALRRLTCVADTLRTFEQERRRLIAAQVDREPDADRRVVAFRDTYGEEASRHWPVVHGALGRLLAHGPAWGVRIYVLRLPGPATLLPEPWRAGSESVCAAAAAGTTDRAAACPALDRNATRRRLERIVESAGATWIDGEATIMRLVARADPVYEDTGLSGAAVEELAVELRGPLLADLDLPDPPTNDASAAQELVITAGDERLELVGFHSLEANPEGEPFAWSGSESRITISGLEAGEPCWLGLSGDHWDSWLELGTAPDRLRRVSVKQPLTWLPRVVRVDPDGRLHIHIRAAVFRPSDRDPANTDSRPLGFSLRSITILPVRPDLSWPLRDAAEAERVLLPVSSRYLAWRGVAGVELPSPERDFAWLQGEAQIQIVGLAPDQSYRLSLRVAEVVADEALTMTVGDSSRALTVDGRWLHWPDPITPANGQPLNVSLSGATREVVGAPGPVALKLFAVAVESVPAR